MQYFLLDAVKLPLVFLRQLEQGPHHVQAGGFRLAPERHPFLGKGQRHRSPVGFSPLPVYETGLDHPIDDAAGRAVAELHLFGKVRKADLGVLPQHPQHDQLQRSEFMLARRFGHQLEERLMDLTVALEYFQDPLFLQR